jgi:hypothetical protein
MRRAAQTTSDKTDADYRLYGICRVIAPFANALRRCIQDRRWQAISFHYIHSPFPDLMRSTIIMTP